MRKKQYLCRRIWRSMTALPYNLYNCLKSSSPHHNHFIGLCRGPHYNRIYSKKGGTYEKDWNGIGDACMRSDGASR